jgi:hypothetical protein
MAPNVKIKDYSHKTAVFLPPAVLCEKDWTENTISHSSAVGINKHYMRYYQPITMAA